MPVSLFNGGPHHSCHDGRFFAKLSAALGASDPNGVLCEPFRQWVIEDDFASERPDWDLAGASFVEDVEPYEDLKLRLLNGTHSFLAYLGALAGKETIADCMADEIFKMAALQLMLEEQAPTLNVPADFKIDNYAARLIERFSNKALQHKTTQIASDGSQKLPQRLLAPVRNHLTTGRHWPLTALAVAGWMEYCRGTDEGGNKLSLNDPLSGRIADIAAQSSDNTYVSNMLALEPVFGTDLPLNAKFGEPVLSAYQSIKSVGVHRALAIVCKGSSPCQHRFSDRIFCSTHRKAAAFSTMSPKAFQLSTFTITSTRWH